MGLAKLVPFAAGLYPRDALVVGPLPSQGVAHSIAAQLDEHLAALELAAAQVIVDDPTEQPVRVREGRFGLEVARGDRLQLGARVVLARIAGRDTHRTFVDAVFVARRVLEQFTAPRLVLEIEGVPQELQQFYLELAQRSCRVP